MVVFVFLFFVFLQKLIALPPELENKLRDGFVLGKHFEISTESWKPNP